MDTLRLDNNSPAIAFRFPDAYGDDWRNMRFRASRRLHIVGAMFAIPTRNFSVWTTGDPAMLVRVWPSDADTLPMADSPWLTDTLSFADFSSSVFSLDSTWRGGADQFVIANFASSFIEVDSGTYFHIGYSAILNSADDSLAILADNGSPQTTNASEYYQGRFVRMRDGWGGVDFFIRAIVDYGTTELQVPELGFVRNDFSLAAVYPNPFNASATITFSLPRAESIRLSIFDVLGREQCELHNGRSAAGTHRLIWNAGPQPSGVYFVRLETTNSFQVKSVVLEK